MGLFGKIFTWWNGATIGTAIHTARHGIKVGSDHLGNIYYRSKDGKRRWVIYDGPNDASTVPPEWHGWLHGTFDELPEEFLPPRRGFERPPTPNLTGTDRAYRPPGAIATGGSRAPATGDYEAWTPGGGE
ncbi:MAG: NADH:ubiquinone oxidoreductase subunit NDUFA12 [Sphingomonadaceae bacterium]